MGLGLCGQIKELRSLGVVLWVVGLWVNLFVSKAWICLGLGGRFYSVTSEDYACALGVSLSVVLLWALDY